MVETKYYCDKCKKEVTGKREGCLKVEIAFAFPEMYYFTTSQKKEFLLCNDCLAKLSIKVPEKEPTEKVLSVEDILIVLCEELGL
jgi:hypothetical protein